MKATAEYDKVIKRSIILCWIALALCFIVKICGGNFFAIAVENERFIAVCEYIDTHLWLSILVRLGNYLLVFNLYFCIALKQLKLNRKQVIILEPIFIITFIIKTLNVLLGNILETVVMIIIPIILSVKWYKSLIYIVIYNLFGFVSVFVKNIGNYYVPEYSLIGLIFSIDIYFMLILFMLYNYENRRI